MTNEEAKSLVTEVKTENPGVEGKKLQTLVGMRANENKVKAMKDSGYSVNEICKETGFAESTVIKILKDN